MNYLSLILAMSVLVFTQVLGDDKVHVFLSYESGWPECQSFTTGALKRVLAKPGMPGIINLELVPYGNTKYDSDSDEFTCQHGSDECEADVLMSCVMYELNGGKTDSMFIKQSYNAWPFIQCMEEGEGDPTKGQSCYVNNMVNTNATTIPWSTIDSCTKQESNTVQKAAMDATPDHQYVPWVLINDVLLENTNTLQKAICDAYTGSKPTSCKFINNVESSAEFHPSKINW